MTGKRTWLGISTHPLDPALGEHLEIPEGFGIQVVEVMPDSPADQAGLRGNDILLRFEDTPLRRVSKWVTLAVVLVLLVVMVTAFVLQRRGSRRTA